MKNQSWPVFGLLMTLMSCGNDSTSASSAFTLYGSSSPTASLMSMQPSTVYNGSPTLLEIRIYEVWVSPNTNCSSPVLLCTNTGADALKDLAAATPPVLCAAAPAAGTYPCMILKIKDTFTFKPDATAAAAVPGGVCVAGTSTQMDIYRQGEADDNLWKDIDGNAIDATGTPSTPGENDVYIFASTTPADISSISHAYQRVTLSSAMVVPGQATFYTDFSNQFSDNGGNCWIEEPTMGFR